MKDYVVFTRKRITIRDGYKQRAKYSNERIYIGEIQDKTSKEALYRARRVYSAQGYIFSEIFVMEKQRWLSIRHMEY